MSAISSRTGRSQSESSIQHRIAARRGQAKSRAELQQEARSRGVPYWYRMKVDKLEELEAKGWNVTEEDIAEFMTTS